MKLIEKLKGAHERPYVAYKVVGYYSSYNDAKEALCHVHTLDDVYQSWLELHSLDVSPHTMKGYDSGFDRRTIGLGKTRRTKWQELVTLE